MFFSLQLSAIVLGRGILHLIRSEWLLKLKLLGLPKWEKISQQLNAKKWVIIGLFFFIFIYSMQLTENKCSI